MAACENPYTVVLSVNPPHDHTHVFQDMDGDSYTLTATIDAKDATKHNFSITGLTDNPENLKVDDHTTSCIIYHNRRNQIEMTFKVVNGDTYYIDIVYQTQRGIQKWFAQFNRNGEGSWMSECTTVGCYKRYCGHYHEAQGTDSTTGLNRLAGYCSRENGQCNACHDFCEEDAKNWQEDRQQRMNMWSSSSFARFLLTKNVITEVQATAIGKEDINAGALIAQMRQAADGGKDCQLTNCKLSLNNLYQILNTLRSFIKSEENLDQYL